MTPRPGFWPCLLCAALGATAALAPSDAVAEGDAAAAEPAKGKPPLSPLPKVPSITLGQPSKEDLETLDDLLKRAVASEAESRDTAVSEILEMPPTLVAAIDHRINAIADGADRGAMKKTLLAVRKEARTVERARMKAEGKRGKVRTPDYLEMLTGHARPDDEHWRNVTRVVVMSRILTHIGTVQASRELIDVYVRFGEFLRVDTQLQLAKLGDKAIAALIETRRHKAAKIGRWAERQLDALGKAIPSEAVQTPDHQALADVLRAFGRVRDPDAARIIISFANSERAQIREAARQGVVMLGEVGNWQLRDTYLQIVGKKPPRDWSWDRTARELFSEYDGLRLSQVYQLFNEGREAEKAKDLPKMKAAYDKVLARSPMFERRSEMAAGYFAFATSLVDEKREDAVDALRRAERVAEDDLTRDRVKSLRLTLEAEELLEQGVADQVLFRRAIELDSSNERARGALDRIQRGEIKKQSELNRYLAAAAIGAVALLALLVIGIRRVTSKAEQPSEKDAAAEDEKAEDDTETEAQAPEDDTETETEKPEAPEAKDDTETETEEPEAPEAKDDGSPESAAADPKPE